MSEINLPPELRRVWELGGADLVRDILAIRAHYKAKTKRLCLLGFIGCLAVCGASGAVTGNWSVAAAFILLSAVQMGVICIWGCWWIGQGAPVPWSEDE